MVSRAGIVRRARTFSSDSDEKVFLCPRQVLQDILTGF